MKPLEEMNNVERAYVLAKLFPTELKEITQFIQDEIDRCTNREEYIRSIWSDNTLIKANFWFSLVQNTQQILKAHNVMLYRSARVFSDQLFHGMNAIFLVNSLIEYAQNKASNPKLF